MMTNSTSITNNTGLQNLLSEPHRLATESERLNNELESLVLDNYKIFVENLTCSVHLRSEDKTLGDLSSELDFNLKHLSELCASFKDKVNNFVSSHKRNRKTLHHHMQLIELLEVPQLVDACARNGFHEEAIELANFVNGLERRHLLANEVKSLNGKVRGGSGVVQSIVDDVHGTLSGLRQQLLHHLTDSLTLPKQIQLLSTLRKLDRMLIDRHLAVERHYHESVGSSSLENKTDGAFHISDAQRELLRHQFTERSEVRLQMDFLEARTIWLERRPANLGTSAVNGASSGNVHGGTGLGPYGQIIEMLETKRTAWFAVVTQFEALFGLENRQIPVSGSSEQLLPPAHIQSSQFVLNAWTNFQVNGLLCELRLLAPLLSEGGSMRAVLEQTLFFANRMGQVGCDFTELVLPLFKEVLVAKLSKEFAAVGVAFNSVLLSETINCDADQSFSSDSHRNQLIPLYSNQDTLQGSAVDHIVPGNAENELPPPQSLLRFPPLAYLINCITFSLNFLRECPLVSAKSFTLQALLTLATDVSVFLVSNSEAIRKSGAKYFGDGHLCDLGSSRSIKAAAVEVEGEQHMDHLYAHFLAFDVFPHLLLCIEAIFSANAVKVVERVRAYKLKYSTASAVKQVGMLVPEEAHLVVNAAQGGELLGKTVFEKLHSHCWSVLAKGGLLPLPASSSVERDPMNARATLFNAVPPTGTDLHQ